MNPEVIYKYFPDLSQNQREQIEKLGPLYRDWNSRINVISRSFFLIIDSDAVKQEFEHRGFIFKILDSFRILKKRHVINGLGGFQGLYGLESLHIMPVDEVEEGLLIPIFHLHRAEVGINGLVFVDLTVLTK